MGEPLNNYKNVVAAVRSMVERKQWNMRYDRVTVSTVGVIPNMKKLTKDLPHVGLALSLHAPNEEMRTKIVPTSKSYPIEGLIEALNNHLLATMLMNDMKRRKTISKKKKVMIEYVMLDGETSSFTCAHQLGKLCEGRYFFVNLIPYNQTDVRDKLRCPSLEHMEEFQRIVMSYGCLCYIRRTMGADVNGACGQLVVSKEKENNEKTNEADSICDIEDTVPYNANSGKDLGGHVDVAKEIKADIHKHNFDDTLISILTGVTCVSATCFIASAILILSKGSKR